MPERKRKSRIGVICCFFCRMAYKENCTPSQLCFSAESAVIYVFYNVYLLKTVDIHAFRTKIAFLYEL
ncbi:MAG TPA: hypothetical protein DCW73_08240 [Treponema sp.]|nr:hypothetical protein [Treponema sp.]